MAASISASVGSYESGAKNVPADVRTVQELLTQAAKNLNTPAFDPKGIDGKIARPGSQSNTVTAIASFQKHQVGMAPPDLRIDVNGGTWKKLVTVAGPVAPKPPAAALGSITLTVDARRPDPHEDQVQGRDAGDRGRRVRIDLHALRRPHGDVPGLHLSGRHDGQGRVIDGTYPLHIGFHKGGRCGQADGREPGRQDGGHPAGLLVNARNPVPVRERRPQQDHVGGHQRPQRLQLRPRLRRLPHPPPGRLVRDSSSSSWTPSRTSTTGTPSAPTRASRSARWSSRNKTV